MFVPNFRLSKQPGVASRLLGHREQSALHEGLAARAGLEGLGLASIRVMRVQPSAAHAVLEFLAGLSSN